jgi:glycosyltransferase involved in cell wall biosynthesis
VLVLGFVSELVKDWLFAHAHVFIAPSYEEGWGGAVADGVASGCWVVTYDLPAVRESCPHGPIFVPLGDRQLFAEMTCACLPKPRPNTHRTTYQRTWQSVAWDDLAAILGQATAGESWVHFP